MAAINDRGAKVLAERLWNNSEVLSEEGLFEDASQSDHESMVEWGAVILGTTGLFIADVTKHEPLYPDDGASMRCYCGHVWSDQMESYFDHIGEV